MPDSQQPSHFSRTDVSRCCLCEWCQPLRAHISGRLQPYGEQDPGKPGVQPQPSCFQCCPDPDVLRQQPRSPERCKPTWEGDQPRHLAPRQPKLATSPHTSPLNLCPRDDSLSYRHGPKDVYTRMQKAPIRRARSRHTLLYMRGTSNGLILQSLQDLHLIYTSFLQET